MIRKKSENKRTREEIVAMLDLLAEMLYRQEPGAADRCFKEINDEMLLHSTN